MIVKQLGYANGASVAVFFARLHGQGIMRSLPYYCCIFDCVLVPATSSKASLTTYLYMVFSFVGLDVTALHPADGVNLRDASHCSSLLVSAEMMLSPLFNPSHRSGQTIREEAESTSLLMHSNSALRTQS